MREPKLVKRPESRFSVRVEPFWLNPATVKGTILILAGLVILAFPEASIFLIRIVIGVALVGSGFSDLWFHVLRGQTSNRGRDAIEGLLATAAGVVFLLYPSETLRSVTLLTAIYLAARGVTVVISVVRQRGDTRRLANALRGASLIVFALVLVLLPETVVASLVVAFAVVAIVLGALSLPTASSATAKTRLPMLLRRPYQRSLATGCSSRTSEMPVVPRSTTASTSNSPTARTNSSPGGSCSCSR